MSGLMVPRGLGLVAALAVSGTALYLAYGFKKGSFLNIRRGKGSLRLEYHPAVQPLQALKKESGVSLELTEGKEIDIVEIHCHHLPCQRRAGRRQQQQQLLQAPPPLLLLPAAPSREENELRERLEKCNADAALVKSLQTTLASYKVTGPLAEQFQNTSDASSDKLSSYSLLERRESLDTDSETEKSTESPSRSCVESLAVNVVSLRGSPLPSFTSSVEDDCGSKTLSSASSAPSCGSAKYALVGCFVRSGSNKAGKQKKMVRFSPSVAEPSSNNHDYRRRFKAQIAQRAVAQQYQYQKPQPAPPPSEAIPIRSIAYERPRLHSQAAKQTITYNVHRADGRYIGRTNYHF